ncbi:hypothetical protein AHAS_Ahas09G0081600 [Arachis hypogaea]
MVAREHRESLQFLFGVSPDALLEPDCKPSSPLSDNEISENVGLKRHTSTTKRRGQKATSSIKKKIPTRGDFKLQRGRPWLYESHDLVNIYGDEIPTCLEVTFRPTSEMVFMGTELAIVAYIFGTDYDPNGLITYLDSPKCSKQRHERMNAIYDVISFLENLLLDYWFYQLDNTKRPMVSKFKFQEPEVPQQDAQS